MTDPIRVLLADDHPIYRDGVARTLSDAGGIDVVGQASDGEMAVQLAERLHPDLVLLDLSMPGGGGLAALSRILALDTAPRVAILTASEEDGDLLQAMGAGAVGYILKGVGARELVSLVRDLSAGQSYVAPGLARRMYLTMRGQGGEAARTENPLSDLTRREEEILRLVAQGKSNREVGRDLDIQEKTVKHYMTSIMQKPHVPNRVEEGMLAREYGQD